MITGILDYGSGNLHSVTRAVEAAGSQVVLSADHDVLARTNALVVPGVGAFAACMDGLINQGSDTFIRDWVRAQKPLLGICVGHQILYAQSDEHVVQSGLGIHDGTVTSLAAKRLPHMGWNTVTAPKDSALFAGLADARFYFVHSYAALPQGADYERVSEHGGHRFVAAIEKGNVCSTQFHPEKSGAAGARLLRNWLALAAAAGPDTAKA